MRFLAALGVVIGTVIAVATVPATALAQDPADSITLTAPQGPVYVNDPFTFTGGGSVDGSAYDYDEQVLFVPSSSGLIGSSCPPSEQQLVDAINAKYGPYASGSLSATGVGTALPGDSGPYTYSASVNSDVFPTVTAPGTFVACAFLDDDIAGDTLAVSTPVTFSVTDPPGTGPAPTRFGGPPSHRGHPGDLTLTITSSRRHIDAPGRNLLHIRGRYSSTSGPDGLLITLTRTSRYNGCAVDPSNEEQIVHSDGGVVLSYFDTARTNSAGVFDTPFALRFKRPERGTLEMCAYLMQNSLDDVAVGYKRFTTVDPAHGHGGATRRR